MRCWPLLAPVVVSRRMELLASWPLSLPPLARNSAIRFWLNSRMLMFCMPLMGDTFPAEDCGNSTREGASRSGFILTRDDQSGKRGQDDASGAMQREVGVLGELGRLGVDLDDERAGAAGKLGQSGGGVDERGGADDEADVSAGGGHGGDLVRLVGQRLQ